MKVPFLDLKLQHAPLRAEVLAALADTYDNTRFCLGKDVENCSPGELGARTVEIIDAAYRSAASGRLEEIDG